MNAREWRSKVIESLDGIADREQQRVEWLDQLSRYISSPVEEICTLMDDSFFEAFLNDSDVALSEHQRKKAVRLIEKIDDFPEEVSLYDAKAVIDHPKWIEISEAAKELHELLKTTDM